MRLYAITVRRWWAVLLAIIALIAVCWSLGATEVPVPSLIGGMTGARLAYFTPLFVVVATLYCLERRLPHVENAAVVGITRLDLSVVLLVVLGAHAAGLIVGMDIARNITLLLSLALLIRRLTNEAAAATAGLMCLIASLMLGRTYQPGGEAGYAWWALPLYPADSIAAWLAATAFLTVVTGLGLAGRSRY
ncbi:hypothetical protein ACIRD4_24545 [Streptomyces clavifer]|uniref:hypothetical protein n=1 Tax=Streptomyces clavifer TaxID=68188 RepID=UPI0037FE036D